MIGGGRVVFVIPAPVIDDPGFQPGRSVAPSLTAKLKGLVLGQRMRSDKAVLPEDLGELFFPGGQSRGPSAPSILLPGARFRPAHGTLRVGARSKSTLPWSRVVGPTWFPPYSKPGRWPP